MSTERTELIYGRRVPLPFYQYYNPTKLQKTYPVDPSWAWESCGSKIITNGMIGAIGGIGIGLFMGRSLT
jgi:hypothetical protein